MKCGKCGNNPVRPEPKKGYCILCGSKLDDGVERCTECGAPVLPMPDDAEAA